MSAAMMHGSSGPMFVRFPPGLESLCYQRMQSPVDAPLRMPPPAGCLHDGLESTYSFSVDQPLSTGEIFRAAYRGELPFLPAWPAAQLVEQVVEEDMPEYTVKTSYSSSPTLSYDSSPTVKPSYDNSLLAACGEPECVDDAKLEVTLEPILRSILGQDLKRSKGKQGQGGFARWWTQPHLPLLCPLTRFPICLLPYPPFKLRVDHERSSPHRLVDGKFLAMTMIVTGDFAACGRELQASDISALDDYVHRCKLGPYRPGRVVLLTKEAQTSDCAERRAAAALELERFIASARAELGKLRRIQENRMLQINRALPAHVQALMKNSTQSPGKDSPPSSPAKDSPASSQRGHFPSHLSEGRFNSRLSDTSTHASLCSAASDTSED
ncbi:unnamed protein product [Polarella glacialis]|uniref:Uncharacterized protein n=1 Tax=Polarella glacialis TaxID=89957 RepID=A0A813KMZ7_POLGL|nr:unnamed protein product [Polarella glacialis]